MRAWCYVTIAGDVTFTAAEGGHHTIVAKHYLHDLSCWQKKDTTQQKLVLDWRQNWFKDSHCYQKFVFYQSVIDLRGKFVFCLLFWFVWEKIDFIRDEKFLIIILCVQLCMYVCMYVCACVLSVQCSLPWLIMHKSNTYTNKNTILFQIIPGFLY